METPNNFNEKSLKGFIKGSLVIAGLYFVLSYGVITLLVSKDINNLDCKVFSLIIIFAILPLIVFFGLSFLVKSFYRSLCNKYEVPLLKIHKKEAIVEACLMVAKALKLDSGKDGNALQNLLKELLLLFLNIGSEEKSNNSEYKIIRDDGEMIIVFSKSKSNGDSSKDGDS